MTACVVLLRAVNVGGRSLPMAAFRAALARAKVRGARTVGTSGNAVIAVARGVPDERIERAIEAALERHTGLVTDAFVRSSSEWEGIVRENPFRREADSDPAHLVVTVLKSTPSPASWEGLRQTIVGRERFVAADRHAYIVYPDGIGRSKITPGLLERELGTRGTSRNWNTVLALRDLLRGPAAPAQRRSGRSQGR